MFKRFIRYYKNHLGLFILDMICATLVAGVDLVFPLVTSLMTKNYIPNKMMDKILLVGGCLLALYLFRLVLQYVISYWGHMMGTLIEKDMREDLFKKYETLDYQFFDDNKVGTLMSNLTNHLRDVSEMSHHAPEDLFISLIMLIGSFTILMGINPILTLSIFGVVIIEIIFCLTRRRKQLASFRGVRKFHGELNSRVESSISGIRLTKAFANESYENKKFKKTNDEYQDSWKQAYKQMTIFNCGNEFLIELTNLVLLVLGGYLVYSNKLIIADLLTYFLYVNYLTKPINRLMAMMQQLQQGFAGIETFHEIMEIKPDIQSPKDGIKDKIIEGNISFVDASFRYKEQEDILNNFNLNISKGEKIAIVGETGVGKTTISKLIPRFYDLSNGQLLIDGLDIKTLDLSLLRNSIGYVQQDVFIFYGTIEENIKYGKTDATFEEVVEAAKNANIHDFIMTLPNGYQTITGERGVKLSGGQKQRISIARLFLKNPPIIILDEATSSLDNITEKLIQEAFDRLLANKTSIIIAHRLSTIKNSDRIIVLGKEGIIEEGKHDELIKKEGYYNKLYNASVQI